ncbi:hypothetical protein A9Q81_01850 [Gammaproteobacteria bacterium 42_54_T18]|nr:hypothetical protein A9Q81_01850 [Gammaproteobacteria bacterium 42_54_T18]
MNEEEFLDKAKITLDQHADELDGSVLARLNEARYRALHPEEVMAGPRARSWFAWGGSIATASLVAVFWLVNPIAPLTAPGNSGVEGYVATSDVQLIEDAISNEDIAMLDNIEFVAWLMEQDESNAG